MFSIDLFRHVRECIDPTEYLSRRYYDQWLQAHATMLVDAGAVTVEELATGKSARPFRDAATHDARKGSEATR